MPASGATVVTQWTRLAFDPDTLLVDTADFAFATSKGSVNHPNDTPGGLVVTRGPYGVARDCAAPSSTLGTANIDLTGLPFEVDLAATKWGSDGAEAAGTMASADARVISVKGGGYCGWHAISSNRFGGKLLVLRYRP